MLSYGLQKKLLTTDHEKAVEQTARVVVVLLLTLFSYHYLTRLSFALPDDGWMLLKHELVHPEQFSFDYVYTVFTTFNDIQYSPLNTLCYYLIYQINGYDPFYYHLFSFFIHLLNIAVVYRVAKEILLAFSISSTTLIAWLTSLVWAIHPINVESVVWISASKIVLFTFFSLLSFLYFARSLYKPRVKYQLLTVFFFLLSCFCKEQAVVEPTMCILYHICYRLAHPEKKAAKSVYLTILALLAITVAFTYITMKAKGFGIPEGLPMNYYPFYQRVLLSFFCTGFYLTNGLLPFNLDFFYEFPIKPNARLPISLYLYPAAFAALLILLLAKFRRTGLHLFFLFCAGLFAIHIALVLQIIPLARRNMLADRYMYIPSFALQLSLMTIIVRALYARDIHKAWKRLLCAGLFVYVSYLALYSNHLVQKWEHLNVIK